MKLFHEARGAGRPLVALHGGYGLDHTYLWLEVPGWQLILPDLRGCGRSPREELGSATLATLSDDVDELRAQLGHARWSVLGHSFGSYVALEYAHRHPERVEKLALVSGAPAFDYPDIVGANLAARGTPEQGSLLQKATAGVLESDEEFRRAWNLLLPLYFRKFDPQVARKMDEPMRYSAEALFHGFRMLAQFSALPWLGELRMPAFCAAGRHDWIAPPAQGAQRLARGIPDTRLAIFEDSGHFPFIEEPERFQELLRKFLA